MKLPHDTSNEEIEREIWLWDFAGQADYRLIHQLFMDESKALLRMGELKQQLEMRLPGEAFTLEQLRAVVGLLAGPEIVWQLEFGDFVLLQRERRWAGASASTWAGGRAAHTRRSGPRLRGRAADQGRLQGRCGDGTERRRPGQTR
jgi:hypothetical protein